ncbi:unnamed protein product, partial [Choristocarpus tenellus]
MSLVLVEQNTLFSDTKMTTNKLWPCGMEMSSRPSVLEAAISPANVVKNTSFVPEVNRSTASDNNGLGNSSIHNSGDNGTGEAEVEGKGHVRGEGRLSTLTLALSALANLSLDSLAVKRVCTKPSSVYAVCNLIFK